MVTAREAIKDILHPIRHNDLEARRRRLKLSRVALARILDVDPATVYRQERSVMSALWDYAMRGIEAEAKSCGSKAFVRDQQAKVARQAMIPDAVAERGFGYTAEKMKAVKRRPKVAKPMPRNIPCARSAVCSMRNFGRSISSSSFVMHFWCDRASISTPVRVLIG